MRWDCDSAQQPVGCGNLRKRLLIHTAARILGDLARRLTDPVSTKTMPPLTNQSAEALNVSNRRNVATMCTVRKRMIPHDSTPYAALMTLDSVR
jgi:hypothetical protein